MRTREIARRFEKLGYIIYATRSTAAALKEAGIKARQVNKINQESPTVMDLILGHRIDLVIDTPTQGRDKSRDGFLIRRTAIETGVNCLTSLDTARALVGSLETKSNELSLIDIAKPIFNRVRRLFKVLSDLFHFFQSHSTSIIFYMNKQKFFFLFIPDLQKTIPLYII